MLNLVVGIVFIVSAILKIISIDSFELYIYSFQFVGLNLSSLAARAFICAELILGTGLILNLYPKFFRISTILLLVFFSLFLVYVYFAKGNEDNCHCFGDLIELNPIPSIIKNIILIALLLPGYRLHPFTIRFKKQISIITAVVVVVIVFIVSFPTMWYSAEDKNSYYNDQALSDFLSEHPALTEKNDQTIVACFFGLGCRYCELTAQKIHLIQESHSGLNLHVAGILWGDETKYENFTESTGLIYSDVIFLNPMQFLQITNGSMPLVIIFRNGEVVNAFKYSDLQEKAFLKAVNE